MSKRDSNLRDPNNAFAQLNPRQQQFALFVAEGKSHSMAAKMAGYQNINTAKQHLALARKPIVQQAVRHLQKRYEDSIVASRKMVLEGFLEAIEQAKLMSDPSVQVAGWREIGRMCGYYAPEVKEVNLHVGAKRVVGQLEVLSDAELLDIIEKEQDTLEGDAHEILDTSHESRDTASSPG